MTMRLEYGARRGRCVLLLGICTAVLAACSGLPGTIPVSNTPVIRGVPPSVAAFCPSPEALAPIVGETMIPDDTTFTHGSLTSCGYRGPTGDICGVDITAWADAQSARDDYNSFMNAAVETGGHVQAVTGLGDAAFYFVDESITVLKGPDDFTDKCFFLPPRQQAVDEQVDVQFAQLLLTRL
jgi:hypothetical protein